MPGHALRDGDVTAVVQVVGDPDGAERVIAFGGQGSGVPCATAHHVPGIDARYGALGEPARPADGRAKQRALLVLRNASGSRPS